MDRLCERITTRIHRIERGEDKKGEETILIASGKVLDKNKEIQGINRSQMPNQDRMTHKEYHFIASDEHEKATSRKNIGNIFTFGIN